MDLKKHSNIPVFFSDFIIYSWNPGPIFRVQILHLHLRTHKVHLIWILTTHYKHSPYRLACAYNLGRHAYLVQHSHRSKKICTLNKMECITLQSASYAQCTRNWCILTMTFLKEWLIIAFYNIKSKTIFWKYIFPFIVYNIMNDEIIMPLCKICIVIHLPIAWI